MKGSESHKNIDLSGNPILKLYYTSRVNYFIKKIFFFFVCLIFFIDFRNFYFSCVLEMSYFMPCYILSIFLKDLKVFKGVEVFRFKMKLFFFLKLNYLDLHLV
jgi:hypothetical protein